jgi:predicted ATP-grasp superfamily ATP-dependent carboligase
MNLYYTGLGIARSLGQHGVRVIGLTTDARTYGAFSRYVEVVKAADSRSEPAKLLGEIVELGRRLDRRAILFPTRDHDLVFIDRYRRELEPYFIPLVPSHAALEQCLDKWETYQVASRLDVPTPRSWLIRTAAELRAAARDVQYPCVLKPVAAHHWRSDNNWQLVGGRKAISITSAEDLLREYELVAAAHPDALLQEQVPGPDDRLAILACYVDGASNIVAGFNAQKLVQTPPTFGTGCILQSTERPELAEPTARLLKAIGFTGVAEVEYKWDSRTNQYSLIEINPRPWDQHRLGAACGVDLMHIAYCDLAGLPAPAVHAGFVHRKWVAEDSLVLQLVRLVWRREGGVRDLLHQARGTREYAIWSIRDPLPFVVSFMTLVAGLAGAGFRALRRGPAKPAADAHKARMRVAP